jgi:Zn-dependent M28 family amino/carboxypeptidase
MLARQAEIFALAITDPYRQARVLARLARAAAAAGDLDRAQALAQEITDLDQQAKALADAASKAAPDQARSLLAQALTLGHWSASVNVLVEIDPAAVITIADQYLSTTPSPESSLGQVTLCSR